MMENIYKNGKYLKLTGETWHSKHSPWKANRILDIIIKNGIHPKSIAEIGCGAGQIIAELSQKKYLDECTFEGYDISPQAIELCMKIKNDRCKFFNQDIQIPDDISNKKFDILLVIDVIEHVPDYINFLEKYKRTASYIIYHIPLEICISAILRKTFIPIRKSIGHLHHFTAETALQTLKDTGHEILDHCYTDTSFQDFKHRKNIKTGAANTMRWLLSLFSKTFAAQTLGGYSILVLTK